jgi:hypothetical protein
MSFFYVYHKITLPNAQIPTRVLAYYFDQNKAYMKGVTYKYINISRTTINFDLIYHLNNKRSTIGVIQIWSQS